MLSMNITAPAVVVTANAELGRVGIANSETLSLLSTLDAGVTIRAHKGLGSLRVSHQKTKELGGAYRHSLRFDLNANGDLPPAFVNLVICAKDSSVGSDRAIEAYLTLIGLIHNERAEPAVAGGANLPTLAMNVANALGDDPESAIWTLGSVLNGEG